MLECTLGSWVDCFKGPPPNNPSRLGGTWDFSGLPAPPFSTYKNERIAWEVSQKSRPGEGNHYAPLEIIFALGSMLRGQGAILAQKIFYTSRFVRVTPVQGPC